MNKKNPQPNDVFFALDIGTRSVMGILGRMEQEEIFIDHSVMEFHKKRAMIDGQIHDIEQVADCVRHVKETLEEKSGYALQRVAIAAAGRSLKTLRLHSPVDIDEHVTIDKNIIKSLEIEIIQQAQKHLAQESSEQTAYYNVGHTVVNYFLDDAMITNPVGHKGKKLSADVIGTFLPQIVVDSLEAVMEKIGLEVSYMTLEPIAAIEVAVPTAARLLNLALVDIGAGTSDIAITKEGSVTAYAMAPTAGDEITECIATSFLLDFDAAEILKCNLNKEENQVFYDIVGMKVEKKTEEILDLIDSSIDVVANNIAENILLQNGKSPSAVFMIGGGSQIPRLGEKVAQKLELPKERVVIKGAEHLNHLSKGGVGLKGPECVTPIGIMAASAKNQKNDFMDVKVNGKSVRMFRSSEMKVSDALILSGYNPRDLIPRKGKSLSVKINGRQKTFFGGYGEEAKIFLNGKSGNLESKIEDGDEIRIEAAVQGKDAEILLSELEDFKKNLQVNEKTLPYVLSAEVNGEEKRLEYPLREGDEIRYIRLDRMDRIAEYLKMPAEDCFFYKNGEPAEIETEAAPSDKIEIELRGSKTGTSPMKESTSANPPVPVRRITVLCNGKPVELQGEKEEFIFVDIFDFISFDRSRSQGKLLMLHNGRPAVYTDPLCAGDILVIRWE